MAGLNRNVITERIEQIHNKIDKGENVLADYSWLLGAIFCVKSIHLSSYQRMRCKFFKNQLDLYFKSSYKNNKKLNFLYSNNEIKMIFKDIFK